MIAPTSMVGAFYFLMDKFLLVMFGGAIGSLARYLAGTRVLSLYPGRFPLGTVIVNVTGCFLIGVVMTTIRERGLHPNWALFLVVGCLGGYTTFSSFAWETFVSARAGRPWIGLANVLISVTLGYLAVWLGALSASKR